jgi:hypothetical protein
MEGAMKCFERMMGMEYLFLCVNLISEKAALKPFYNVGFFTAGPADPVQEFNNKF